MQDLMGYKHLPILSILLEDMRDQLYHYEIKLSILQRLLPIMKTSEANDFIQLFEDILDKPAKSSIFRLNLNPLRIGLMLYKTFDDI